MGTKKKNFGEFLRELRIKAGYGLRNFAALIDMPASNLSAIEHGRRMMPQDKLNNVAEIMGLEKGSSDWNTFFDLSAEAGSLPLDVKQVAASGFVPALLRTIDNNQLTDDQIKNLIHDIQGGNGLQKRKPH